jgi:hypothetical protein
MSGAGKELTYTLDFRAGMKDRRARQPQPDMSVPTPRIAKLMALAIRFERLVQEDSIRSYAELARLGYVTRARMTQIMKLLNLAPDIQEQILFLPSASGLNERNLRPVVRRIEWDEQRRLFQELMSRAGVRGQ